MPICPSCRKWIEAGEHCVTCGRVRPEMTAVDLPMKESEAIQPIAHEVELAEQAFASVVDLSARPPMARLVAIDDDCLTDGEIWRLRRTETSIGRHGCDVTIDHDPDISATHCSIRRHLDEDGGWRWELIDCESTNGTFLMSLPTFPTDQPMADCRRIISHELVEGTWFRIGQQRFRFETMSNQVQPVTP